MTEQTERFFGELKKKRHVPLLEGRSGTLVIEIKDGKKGEADRWYVTIQKGDVGVSRTGSTPDGVLRTDGKTFDAIVAGKMNAVAATLRGLVDIEGRADLMIALQALFRPSAGAADQREAGYAGRRS